MAAPVICVCIGTYNQAAFIETCIRSVLDQKVEADVRVLVGDDASTDATSEIIHRLVLEYGDRLMHIHRDHNLGAFANMRDVVLRADGDFIARVDGDDYWLPGKLARQLAYMRQYGDCSAVYTNAITVDQSGTQLGNFNDVGDSVFNIAQMLRHGNFLNNSSVLFRGAGTAAWRHVEVQIDYQAHLWHARYGLLGHIGQPLVAYRVGTQNSLMRKSEGRVRELYWQAIHSVPKDLIEPIDHVRAIADFMRRVFFRSVRTRDAALFKYWFGRGLAESPFGWFRTCIFFSYSVLRMAVKLASGWLLRAFSPGAARVLYRR